MADNTEYVLSKEEIIALFPEEYAKLQRYAAEYVADKAEEAILKKKIEANNQAIKDLMVFLKLDDVDVEGGGKVVYSVSQSENMDEETLIKVLHKFAPQTQCIKTREYIDKDVLESEIYHEEFSEGAMEALQECITVTETPKLTIKKGKKGK